MIFARREVCWIGVGHLQGNYLPSGPAGAGYDGCRARRVIRFVRRDCGGKQKGSQNTGEHQHHQKLQPQVQMVAEREMARRPQWG